ncbi:PVC-type heme-binding CxxCH protein [Ulvibacterium sp.]|uniref:PVC-type heme-binding CxxCH protein n=1 Tax=Ulvibacterium sp. TaxID=2665914 RepID=UPI003BAD23CD
MKNIELILPFTLALLLSLTSCKDDQKDKATQVVTRELPQFYKKMQSNRTAAYSPEEQLAGFKVPEGFKVELVASEKDGIVNPIDLTFDDAGRLWTQTAGMYPLDPISDIQWDDLLRLMDNPEAQEKNPNFKRILDLYRGITKGEDKILVLSDLYSGKKAKTSIWADGLTIPQSILPYKNGSYVAQGSELFFLEDTDDDGKADKRKPLFTGFGYTDTHTMAHTLIRGPGDWIHFSQGALNKGEVSSVVSSAKIRLDYSKIVRFSLDAKKIKLVNSGLNNIWGFQLRGNGQWYGSEANDLGFSVAPMEVGTGFPGTGNDRLRPYQPWMPTLHDFRVGGTGLSGLAFADDSEGSFPEEWRDVALLANTITSTINAVKIVRNADGSVSAEHLPDLLSSKDDWFRPVNIEFGPDGCLYIADWYNKIISHNEVPTTHPDRDKSHGRIWRICHESQKPHEIPNFYKVKTEKLVDFLKSPSLWAKRAAWHQISDRPIGETKGLTRDLLLMVSDISQDEITRILALWSLEGIYRYDRKLMKPLVSSESDNLRREAVRALQSFSPNADELARLLQIPLEDSNPMVRSQVLRTLGQVGKANEETIALLVQACKPPMEGNTMGGAYERHFERYLARMALEKYPRQLSDFMASKKASEHAPSNLIWASQALPKKEREAVFPDLWKKAGYTELNEPTFIIVAEMLGNTNVFDAVSPIFERHEKAGDYVALALRNQAKVQSDELKSLLVNPIRHLLKSKEISQQNLGLEAIGKFEIQGLRDYVVPLIHENSSEETIKLAMLALKERPKENKGIFSQMAKKDNLSLELRAAAIQTLASGDLGLAGQISGNWMPKLQETKQRTVVKILSNSKEARVLLKQLFASGSVSSKAFDLSSAEKIFQANEEDKIGKKLLNEVMVRIEKEKKAFDAKLKRFMVIAEKGGGNPAEGEKLFQTCLLCHSLGDKGQHIAPALDGSAMRENKALLTAILDPDAAMEGTYTLYRVTKKDGSTVEGYLTKREDKGLTIGFMGGNEQFVSAADISSQGRLVGRSFMPKGLIDHYSDEQVSDLLAYIRTLK